MKFKFALVTLLAAPFVLAAPHSVQARNRKKTVDPTQPAPVVLSHGRRTLFLLPLQLGTGWNANSVFTREYLPQATRALKDAFRATGRYSLVEALQSDPIIQRGLADELFTAEEYKALIDTPTIESANPIVTKMTFDRLPKLQFSDAPQIMQVTMDRFPAQIGRPAIQIVARLYDAGLTVPTRTLTVIAGLQNKKALTSPQLTLASTIAGFNRLSQEFAKSPAEAELPFLPSPVLPTATAAATGGATDTPAADAPAADAPAADGAKEEAPKDAGGADNPAE